MKTTIISDFHGILPELEPTDLLLICGDISPFANQGNIALMELWFKYEFRMWVAEQICDKVIIIPGNHDFYLERLKTETSRGEFENQYFGKLKCLWNEYYEYTFEDKVYKIFGTPYCHIYGNWPFMRSSDVLSKKFESIPSGLDILLTHDPVFALGNSDVILKPKYKSQAHFEHVGNKELHDRLMYMENESGLPKYCFCGHIHSGEHNLEEYLGMQFANVSLMDEYCNKLVYKPLIIEI